MKSLKIYFTSDIHGYFYPTTYGDKSEKNLGLLKCANQFEKDGNTLILDGGDILQGSAFTYYCQKELRSNQAIARIMNLCGYDYVTLGNHDFNYGQQYLMDYLRSLKAKCVCQNIIGIQNEILFPYDIKTMENGLRVGIVGIVTEYVNVWEKKENLEGICITDPFEEAKKALGEIKDKADLTVCIYHGGFEIELGTGRLLSSTSENIAYKICEELDFDILLTGHQHMSIAGQTINGTYVVQPKENGQEFHYIEVNIYEDKKDIYSECRKAQGKCDLTAYTAMVEIENNVQSWLDKTVGELQEDLLPDSRIHMAAKGSKIADFLNKIQLYYSRAQISAVCLANEVAGFKSKVTRRDIITSYPYANTLLVLEISGKKLKEAIERTAEYFSFGEDGEIEVSSSFMEPKVEHYNYDFFAGIRYKINPRREIGKRVEQLKYGNVGIMENDKFSICINNYRASGAGNYPMYPRCKVIKEINTELVELIFNYFELNTGRMLVVDEPIIMVSNSFQ
jgi:2',3'-cyclic-nucleotide 2'-phosphodiesterase/3'-nucleotidase